LAGRDARIKSDVSLDAQGGDIRDSLSMNGGGIFPYEMFRHGMLILYIDAMQVR
jgi:hypothetical protein